MELLEFLRFTWFIFSFAGWVILIFHQLLVVVGNLGMLVITPRIGGLGEISARIGVPEIQQRSRLSPVSATVEITDSF